MSLTALQLVNRILRLERLGDVTSFTDDRSLVTLDLLNEAKREVLEEHVFDFDRRGDGVLTTSPVYTPLPAVGAFGFTKGSKDVTFVGLFSPLEEPVIELIKSRIAYIVNSSDDDYGNTAFRIDTIGAFIGPGLGTQIVLNTEWPGETVNSTSWRIFVPEFILPDTVRKITSVKHEEQDLRLSQITHGTSFQQVVPRLSENFSQPGIAAVGGYGTSTYDHALGAPDPGLRMLIWPIEEEPMVLHYQYVYRHPDLADPTDELVGVPLHIVDNIIDLAFSKSVSTIGKDIESGRALRQDANSSRRRKQNADNPSPLRRFSMASMDRMASSQRREDTRNLPSPFVDPSTGT